MDHKELKKLLEVPQEELTGMSEKEKRQKGYYYRATEDSIFQDILRAKDICLAYNQLPSSQLKARDTMLRGFLGKMGKNAEIQAPFWCDYGYNIELGDDFYANHNMVILDGAKVTFGNHVFVAPDCGFYCAGHPMDAERRNQGLEYAWPITVGDNVWIGAGCRILPGVTIGHDSVIGAGSIVNRDIPAGVLAAGNPAKVIRRIL